VTAENDSFLDVVAGEGWFTIPRLKWRELVFIRAVRRDGDDWVRDPDRFMPPFAAGDLLPVGQRFCVTDEGERVRIASLTGES
jgi:hypothetical protein